MALWSFCNVRVSLDPMHIPHEDSRTTNPSVPKLDIEQTSGLLLASGGYRKMGALQI
jgi:hypothetical protein